MVHMPLKENKALDETPEIKVKNLSKINELLNLSNSEAIKVVDFHSVSPGFCARRHVIYRYVVCLFYYVRSHLFFIDIMPIVL